MASESPRRDPITKIRIGSHIKKKNRIVKKERKKSGILKMENIIMEVTN